MYAFKQLRVKSTLVINVKNKFLPNIKKRNIIFYWTNTYYSNRYNDKCMVM